MASFKKLKFLPALLLVFTVVASVCLLNTTAYAKSYNVKVKKVAISNVEYYRYAMKVGNSKKLKVTVTPKRATQKKVKWKSSNPKVVKVLSNGKIKALKKGTAIITATATDGSKKKDKVKVIVGVPVKKISANDTNFSLVSGLSKNMDVHALPTNASYKKLNYSSSNKNIVSVSSKGVVTAKKSGTVTVTIASADSRSKKSIKIKSYYKSQNYTMALGETINAKDIAYKKWVDANNNIKYSSSNTKVAVVNSKGVIVPIKKGKTTITLTNGLKKTNIDLTVGIPVNTISVNNLNDTLNIAKSVKVKLDTLVSPNNSTDKTLTYSSGNEKIAKVDSKGYVKGVSVGTTTITISSHDKRAKLKVNVKVYSGATLKIQTTDGPIVGYKPSQNIASWHDIPYAQAPVGELRWKAPRDNFAWTEELYCDTSSVKAAQYDDDGDFIGTEDCLYMNINRPNTNEKNIPVFVYLHGGSNVKGSKSSFSYKKFCQANNAIVVTVNYRLGALGFFSLDALKTGDPLDDSGNYAILDIKKALEWIQDNIESFGGDKNNVTLSGFSAGAKNVASCIISPLFEGLFHKAIMLSGSATEASVEQAQNSAINGLAKLMVNEGMTMNTADAKEWLNSLTDEEFKEFLYELDAAEIMSLFSTSFNASNAIRYAIKDGYVIPENGFEVIKTGEYNKVPMILGSTESEFAGFLLGSGEFAGSLYQQTLVEGSEKSNLALTALNYSNSLYAGYNVETTARAFALNQDQPPIYAYRFSWGEDEAVTGEEYFSRYVGAHHGSDIDFIEGSFGNNHSAIAPNLFNSENLAGRKELSFNMMEYFANFLHTDNPNDDSLTKWDNWTTENNSLMNFNASKTKDTSKMTQDVYINELIWPQIEQELDKAFLDKYINWRFFGLFRDLFWWI